jgi:hypothetical protein
MPLDKRSLYETFRASLPESLRDDRFFKIFYSDVRPSRIAIIGLNPGGDPGGALAGCGNSVSEGVDRRC